MMSSLLWKIVFFSLIIFEANTAKRSSDGAVSCQSPKTSEMVSLVCLSLEVHSS